MSKVGDVVGGLFGGGSSSDEMTFGKFLRERFAAKKRRRDEIQEDEEARKRAREAEQMRRGRRASILTSGRGVTEPLGSISRPRASSLLGG